MGRRRLSTVVEVLVTRQSALLRSRHPNRVWPPWGALLLFAVSLAVPIALVFDSTHRLYWASPYYLIGPACIVGVGVGAAWLTPRRWVKPHRAVIGIVLAMAAVILAMIAVVMGLSGLGYVRPEASVGPPYAGDYLVLGLHLLVVRAGTVSASIAGALLGSSPLRD